MIHSSDHALSELLLMILLRMASFQMMIEKLIKKNGTRYHKSNTTVLFYLDLFFTFLKNGKCWMSLLFCSNEGTTWKSCRCF